MLADGCQQEALLSIDKAVSILIELSGSLNYDSVAQHRLAVQLDGICNYLIGALTQAGASGDLNALESCEGILVILHDAWSQAVSLERGSKVMMREQAQVMVLA